MGGFETLPYRRDNCLLAVGFLTRKADRICVCSWLIDEIPVSMGWRLVQRLEWVDQSHSIRPNPAGAFARESLQPVGSRRPAPLDITPDLARHSERGIHRLARRASAPQAGTRACGSPTCAAQTGQEASFTRTVARTFRRRFLPGCGHSIRDVERCLIGRRRPWHRTDSRRPGTTAPERRD
jgi:hypothetical protein